MSTASTDRPLRVIQWTTGNIGRRSLHAIIGRPDLQLVGVHAASPNKIRRDAAELCGLDEPIGVVATDDIDALIALKPDCVVYTAQGETRPMEALEQLSKFLAAGINVAATSMVWLLGRIYCTGTPQDYTAVHALQDKITAGSALGLWKALHAAPGHHRPVDRHENSGARAGQRPRRTQRQRNALKENADCSGSRQRHARFKYACRGFRWTLSRDCHENAPP